MALDASVYCNCYELGRVRIAPPQPELVYVDPESGAVSLRSNEPTAEHLFDKWRGAACEHGPFGRLVTHRLGNIAHIAFLRKLFLNAPDRFSTLLSKVVYDGTHMGDVLGLWDVENVANEMLNVSALHCADPSYEVALRDFEKCMMELVQAARTVRKPIVFE